MAQRPLFEPELRPAALEPDAVEPVDSPPGAWLAPLGAPADDGCEPVLDPLPELPEPEEM